MGVTGQEHFGGKDLEQQIHSYSNLFLEKSFAVLGRHVEQEAFVTGLALCLNAIQCHVSIITVDYSVDVSTHDATFLSQSIKQLL